MGLGFNIPITADPKQLEIDLDKAAKATLEASAKIAKNTEGAAGAVKSLQLQFREAQREALNLGQKYGLTSQAATDAFKKAGQLKDEIADSRTIINAFSADSKFTVVAGALQQAAGAASIATGTMALLGVKSEETAQMLLKVQGALALTQGLAQIKEMKASFVALSAVMRADVIPSILAMDVALSASLVGAIAVAGVAIYGIMDDMNEAADSADRLAGKNKEAADSYKDYQSAVNQAYNATAKVMQLQVDGMNEGMAKDQAALNLKISNLQHGVKADFEASNKTIYDSRRLADSQIAIEAIKQKELKSIREKYATKFVAPLVEASEIRLTGNGALQKDIQKSIVDAQDNMMRNIKPISIDNFITVPPKSVFEQTLLDSADSFNRFTDTIKNLAIGAGMDLAYAIGQSLAGAGNFGDTLKAQLSQLMGQVANAVMALGIALAPTNPVLGGVMIGGAIALKIASGVLSQQSGGGAPTSPVGGAGVNTFGMSPSFVGNNSGYGTMRTELEGRKIIISINNEGRIKKR